MKKLCILFVLPFFLSGCLYGQCIDGPCALERQRLLKSIKTYGEFWTKPGMTTESWRQDWIDCGGRKNGSYATDVPQGSTTAVIQEASKKIIQKLDMCMKNKDYFFQRTQ